MSIRDGRTDGAFNVNLELGFAIAAAVLFCLALPIARRALIRRDAHAVLALLAFCAAYAILIAILVVDVAAPQPLPATLRFTRGFAAGIAVGLLASSGAIWVYDHAARRDANRGESSTP